MKSKEDIRNEIWMLMEEKKIARFPGAKGRIPNFARAEACAEILAGSSWWKNAKSIKVNPDSPQRAIRHQALREGKTLYMAVPRLRSKKAFIELDPAVIDCSPYAASSIKGASQYGRPVTLKEIRKIDLIVCGSVAVNRRGARVGKGGGYSDLEFAFLVEEGKVDKKTPIVTSVHPLQIVHAQLPMTEHDIPLSAIITPQTIIDIRSRWDKPKGIYWKMLPEEKIGTIPILQERRRRNG